MVVASRKYPVQMQQVKWALMSFTLKMTCAAEAAGVTDVPALGYSSDAHASPRLRVSYRWPWPALQRGRASTAAARLPPRGPADLSLLPPARTRMG